MKTVWKAVNQFLESYITINLLAISYFELHYCNSKYCQKNGEMPFHCSKFTYLSQLGALKYCSFQITG